MNARNKDEFKGATYIRDEYSPCVWDKNKCEYRMLFQQRAATLDACVKGLKDYAKVWGDVHTHIDFQNVEFRHRVVVITNGDWEKI